MRTLAFLLLPFFASAQSPDSLEMRFALDTFGVDSFFLVETVYQPNPGAPRPYESVSNILFRDTADFSAYLVAVQNEVSAIDAQKLAIGDQYAAWNYKISRLTCLRDSVFYGVSCTGIGARMVTMPPPEEPEYVGFWVVYPRGRAEWVGKLEDIESDAVILHPNGVQSAFKKPKKRKK